MKHLVCSVLIVLFSLPVLAALDPRERYGTFLGGSKNECQANTSGDIRCPNGQLVSYSSATTKATAVTTDAAGNIYVAGYTDAIDFPTTAGAFDRTVAFTGTHICCVAYSDDTFLMKFNASGQLVWSTYLGIQTNGIHTEYNPGVGIQGLAIDSAGNVYVSATYADNNVDFWATLMKINSTGSAVLYSYSGAFASNWIEFLGGMAVDSASAVYLAGIPFYGSGGAVVKVDTTKTGSNSIVFTAPAGGDFPTTVSVDSQHNLYVAGNNYASDFTPSAFLTRMSSSGNMMLNKVFASNAQVIGVKAAGTDAVLAGSAANLTVPATKNFGSGTGTETFIARFTSTGALKYSVVIHDPNMTPIALALDSAGEAFVTGSISASSFRVNPYLNAPSKGAFLARLNALGTALWLDSTFGGDSGLGIAVDKVWNAFVVGTSLPGEYFPLTSNAYQSSFKSAASQGFLAKLIIEADAKMLIQGASPNPVTHGSNLTYTLSVYNNGPDVSDGDTITDVLPAGTTFVSYSTTNGTCTHPAVGYGGTFKCTRSTGLNKGSYWGPVKLTVRVNAAAGTTLKNTASVAAKTQDVYPGNNTATVYVKVQ